METIPGARAVLRLCCARRYETIPARLQRRLIAMGNVAPLFQEPQERVEADHEPDVECVFAHLGYSRPQRSSEPSPETVGAQDDWDDDEPVERRPGILPWGY